MSFNSKIIDNIRLYSNSQTIEHKDNYIFLIQILLLLFVENEEQIQKCFETLFNYNHNFFSSNSEGIDEIQDIGIKLLSRYLKHFQSIPLYSNLIKHIFQCSFEKDQHTIVPCLSITKYLIIDDYIQVLNADICIQNTMKNDKLLRKCLIKIRPYCQKVETLLLIEYFLDNYKINNENNKSEKISALFNNSAGNMNIELPFKLLYRDIRKKTNINIFLNYKENEFQMILKDLNDKFQDKIGYKRLDNYTDLNLESPLYTSNPKPITFIEVSQFNSPNNIIYSSKSNYYLKGIILFLKGTKFFLFVNKYNKYWYSPQESKWLPNIISEYKQATKKIFVYYYRPNEEKYQHKLMEIFYEPKKIKNLDGYEQILKWYKEHHLHFFNENKSFFKHIFGNKYKP